MTPPEADPYTAFAQDGPLTRGDTAQLVAAALHLFPVNGYRSPFADVVGESPLGTAVQCAVQAGLLPARWAADGCLHPAAPVTLGEFLAVLLPGYAIRCPLPAGPDALTQAQAAGLLPGSLPRDPAAGCAFNAAGPLRPHTPGAFCYAPFSLSNAKAMMASTLSTIKRWASALYRTT